MSIQSKFQLSRASEYKMVTWNPFPIVIAPHFTERLIQLCAEKIKFDAGQAKYEAEKDEPEACKALDEAEKALKNRKIMSFRK